MARKESTWYVRKASYDALAAWAANTAYSVGNLVRPTGTTTMRVFLCVVAGTSHATTEPTWTTGWGSSQTDGTVTWREVTGLPAVCGDNANTLTWSDYKAATAAPTVGQIIKNNAGTYLFICNVASSFGTSEPTWNTTTGASTTESGTTWICIGSTSAFSAWQGAASNLNVVINSLFWANAAYGQTIYVADDHYYSAAASQNYSFSTDAATPTYVLCVNHAGSVPPVAADLTTGAEEEATNNNGGVGVYSGSNGLWIHGLTFHASGTGIADAQDRGGGVRTSCTYKTSNAGKTGTNWSSFDGGSLRLFDCTFRFARTDEGINISGTNYIFNDCVFADVGAVPTKLFSLTAGGGMEAHGCDFSAFGSGKTIVGAASSNTVGTAVFERCLLGASVTKMQASIFATMSRVEFLNCDTAANNSNYEFARSSLGGDLTLETTCVRTGGASDGTTPFAWKIVTTSSASKIQNFRCPPVVVWNELTGAALNVDVFGYWSGGAVPTDDDVWLEIEYFGSSGSPISTIVRGFKASPMAAATNHATDSSAWGTGGTTKFKMRTSITPQKKGFVRVTVHCAAPSATFYIDPRVVIS